MTRNINRTEASVKFSRHVKGYTPGLPTVDILHTVCMNCVGIILLTYPSTLANLILSNSAPVPPWLLHSVNLKRFSLMTRNAILGFPLILLITNINISRKKEIDEESYFSSVTFCNVCVRAYLSLFLFLSYSTLYCSGVVWEWREWSWSGLCCSGISCSGLGTGQSCSAICCSGLGGGT